MGGGGGSGSGSGAGSHAHDATEAQRMRGELARNVREAEIGRRPYQPPATKPPPGSHAQDAYEAG